MRRLATLLVVLTCLCATGAPSRAGEPQRPALPWLQNEPVTLLDWGMMRLELDLERALEHLSRSYLRSAMPRMGVYFRFFDRRVVAYVRLVDVPRNRTADACRDVFTRVSDRLLAGAPQGAGGAGWYLESVFGHDSRRGDRPQDLGDQLVDLVVLQVAIGPAPEDAAYGDSPRVTCFGPLNAREGNIALKSEG